MKATVEPIEVDARSTMIPLWNERAKFIAS